MSSRHKIIDVAVNEPAAELPDTDADDASATNPRLRPQSFRDRHALKVLGVIMGVMFATVIVAQVGC